MMASPWPSHKANYVLKQILCGTLGYTKAKGTQSGSHVWLVADGRPRIRWAYHAKRTIAGQELKRILVVDVGLSVEQAKEVLGI